VLEKKMTCPTTGTMVSTGDGCKRIRLLYDVGSLVTVWFLLLAVALLAATVKTTTNTTDDF
jgi:hypothetical protein